MTSPDLMIIKRWTWKQFAGLSAAILLVFAVVSIIAFRIGVAKAISLNGINETLTEQIESLSLEQESMRRELVIQKQISKVDQAANYHAGNSMDSQLQLIRELERELKFFRSIMAPEQSIKGLQISRFSWIKQESGSFSWQLSLIQAGSQGRAVSGFVTLNLIAMQGGKQVVIPISNLQQKTVAQKKRFNYRFKYFQHLDGSLTIPEDLVPLSIEVVAKPAITSQKTIEKQFPWQADEEKLADVG